MLKMLWKMLWHGTSTETAPVADGEILLRLSGQVDSLKRTSLGRSLAIKHVDGGSCNGCEIEIQALEAPLYDLERFGFQFVTAPRHADILLVTGPITANLADAVKQSYEAMAAPKWVVAVGACACDGGAFAESYALHGIATPTGEHHGAGAVATLLPVDIAIPGCPPTPTKLLEALLALIEPIHSLKGTTRVFETGEGVHNLPHPVAPIEDLLDEDSAETVAKPKKELIIEPRQDE